MTQFLTMFNSTVYKRYVYFESFGYHLPGDGLQRIMKKMNLFSASFHNSYLYVIAQLLPIFVM